MNTVKILIQIVTLSLSQNEISSHSHPQKALEFECGLKCMINTLVVFSGVVADEDSAIKVH